MSLTQSQASFQALNKGYQSTFRPSKLSLGVVVPIEHYPDGPVPNMQAHLERVKLVEKLGFAAIWLRDVPFNLPSFGDAGQTYDPFVYLGMLAAQTQTIALGVASVILPLRHPAQVAKAAVTADVLSGGRLLLGIASGDRPEEYPAMNQPFATRGEAFRESYAYIRRMSEDFPSFESPYGTLFGSMDMLPKPTAGKLPLLITGGSQQHPDWVAQNGDGWMTYPRDLPTQAVVVSNYRKRREEFGQSDQPIMQPLYVDLVEDANALPRPIHLGMRLGINYLRSYLKSLESIGINHVALNLRFNQADVPQTLKRLAEELLPDFPTDY